MCGLCALGFVSPLSSHCRFVWKPPRNWCRWCAVPDPCGSKAQGKNLFCDSRDNEPCPAVNGIFTQEVKPAYRSMTWIQSHKSWSYLGPSSLVQLLVHPESLEWMQRWVTVILCQVELLCLYICLACIYAFPGFQLSDLIILGYLHILMQPEANNQWGKFPRSFGKKAKLGGETFVMLSPNCL